MHEIDLSLAAIALVDDFAVDVPTGARFIAHLTCEDVEHVPYVQEAPDVRRARQILQDDLWLVATHVVRADADLHSDMTRLSFGDLRIFVTGGPERAEGAVHDALIRLKSVDGLLTAANLTG